MSFEVKDDKSSNTIKIVQIKIIKNIHSLQNLRKYWVMLRILIILIHTWIQQQELKFEN